MRMIDVPVGTAGWCLPAASRAAFPQGGHRLARYAAVLDAVEINSSFYRAHAHATYAGWAAMTPPGFRFAVKLPRTITHYARLVGVARELEDFLAQVGGLGGRLGRLLVQLPPGLAFDADVAENFFAMLRRKAGPRVGVACEPRHPSWAGEAAQAVWKRHRISRVAADPPRFEADAVPAGPAPPYWRWHGSPRIYYDAYDDARLRVLADALRRRRGAWVIFDNTAHGHATGNALRLKALLAGQG